LRTPTLIRVQLPATEAERLDALFRSTDDRKLRDRLQIVLLAHRGRARQDIAADLGVHRKTVTRWINAYCDAGIDGLRPRKAKGKAGNIPKALADEVKRWVIEGPSRSAVQRFCSGIGIRLYRPTYRYLRGKPEKQAQAKEDLIDLGKGRRPVNSSC
jgi:transposase